MPSIRELVQNLSPCQGGQRRRGQPATAGGGQRRQLRAAGGEVFTPSLQDVHLGLKADNKEAAIPAAGRLLAGARYVAPDYVDAMLERYKLVSTLPRQVHRRPHGTIAAKEHVKRTGIVICQYLARVAFGEGADEVARLVIGIAARNDEHISGHNPPDQCAGRNRSRRPAGQYPGSPGVPGLAGRRTGCLIIPSSSLVIEVNISKTLHLVPAT